jgi:pilus assembly protein CpaF
MSDDLLIERLLADDAIEEIIVLGGGRVFVVRAGRKELLATVLDTPAVRHIADRLLAGTGRRLDLASPIVSAQLEDGSRVHMVGPPITREDQLNIQIRRFVVRGAGLQFLVEMGSLLPDTARLLRESMRADETLLVAGAPGAGKTTLVNALLQEIDADRRVVICEEVFEIRADIPDVTQMQTRDPGLDGGGEVSLRDLVKASLRQRPDRIVVGEVRGPEALDLLLALNAGCAGLATLHANSAVDALEKLVGYCVLAGENVPVAFVRGALASVVDVVVHLKRSNTNRYVNQIARVDRLGEDGEFEVELLGGVDPKRRDLACA